MQIPLEQHVAELKTLAKSLIPYSFPLVSSEEDQEVILLRTRQIFVDGYDLAVTYCISDHDKYHLESLQIQGIYTPFLPFALVCKIARAFLGSDNLSYMDVVRDNRKVYCWSIRTRRGRVLPIKRISADSYEGFTYHVLDLNRSN